MSSVKSRAERDAELASDLAHCKNERDAVHAESARNIAQSDERHLRDCAALNAAAQAANERIAVEYAHEEHDKFTPPLRSFYQEPSYGDCRDASAIYRECDPAHQRDVECYDAGHGSHMTGCGTRPILCLMDLHLAENPGALPALIRAIRDPSEFGLPLSAVAQNVNRTLAMGDPALIEQALKEAIRWVSWAAAVPAAPRADDSEVWETIKFGGTRAGIAAKLADLDRAEEQRKIAAHEREKQSGLLSNLASKVRDLVADKPAAHDESLDAGVREAEAYARRRVSE